MECQNPLCDSSSIHRCMCTMCSQAFVHIAAARNNLERGDLGEERVEGRFVPFSDSPSTELTLQDDQSGCFLGVADNKTRDVF